MLRRMGRGSQRSMLPLNRSKNHMSPKGNIALCLITIGSSSVFGFDPHRFEPLQTMDRIDRRDRQEEHGQSNGGQVQGGRCSERGGEEAR